MSCILFVSTGIQFWLTDYFENVLGFEPYIVNIAYAVVSITGPTSGCGFGNIFDNFRWVYAKSDWRLLKSEGCLLFIWVFDHRHWFCCFDPIHEQFLRLCGIAVAGPLFWRSYDAWPNRANDGIRSTQYQGIW